MSGAFLVIGAAQEPPQEASPHTVRAWSFTTETTGFQEDTGQPARQTRVNSNHANVDRKRLPVLFSNLPDIFAQTHALPLPEEGQTSLALSPLPSVFRRFFRGHTSPCLFLYRTGRCCAFPPFRFPVCVDDAAAHNDHDDERRLRRR